MESKSDYNKTAVFIASCLGMLLFGITLTSLGSILPELRVKFDLTDFGMGSLIAILPFGILLGSLVFGPIVDKYGYKTMLILNTLLVMFGLIGLAYSENYILLQLSIFLFGFGGGVLNGGTNALVADISKEDKGANLSLLGVFFGVGALGFPAILGMYSAMSYQTIIGMVNSFIGIPLLLFFTIRFPKPKQSQGVPLKSTIGLIKNPILILLSFILFFESGMEALINNWNVSYLPEKLNITREAALFSISIHVIGLTFMRLILGWLLRVLSTKIILYISVGLIFIGTLTLLLSPNYILTLIGLFVIGAGFAAVFPTTLGFVGEIFDQYSGTAFSIALVISLTGNMLINWTMGIINYKYLPFMVLGCCFFMFIFLFNSLRLLSYRKL